MVERKKIVLIKHPNHGGQYVFKVPEDVELNCGDYVLCQTVRSDCEVGRCITPSFEIIEPKLKEFYGLAIAQLKPVVGLLRPMMFIYELAGDGNGKD